jgi:hypothetical protein
MIGISESYPQITQRTSTGQEKKADKGSASCGLAALEARRAVRE